MEGEEAEAVTRPTPQEVVSVVELQGGAVVRTEITTGREAMDFPNAVRDKATMALARIIGRVSSDKKKKRIVRSVLFLRCRSHIECLPQRLFRSI